MIVCPVSVYKSQFFIFLCYFSMNHISDTVLSNRYHMHNAIDLRPQLITKTVTCNLVIDGLVKTFIVLTTTKDVDVDADVDVDIDADVDVRHKTPATSTGSRL